MSTDTTTDPFAGTESIPSISFKDAPIGTSYTGTVTEAPALVQARDYESGQPAFWSDGNAKMTVVTKIAIDTGEERALWAAKPSALYRAIAEAQKAAGAQIAVGGTIKVTFTAEKPNEKNPRLNPQKLYSVDYTPPVGGGAFEQAPSPAPARASSPAATGGTHIYTPEQIAAAKAAGIPLPGITA